MKNCLLFLLITIIILPLCNSSYAQGQPPVKDVEFHNQKYFLQLARVRLTDLLSNAQLQQQKENLKLQTVTASQFVSESELAEKVPAEPIIMLEKKGKDVIGDILKEMQ